MANLLWEWLHPETFLINVNKFYIFDPYVIYLLLRVESRWPFRHECFRDRSTAFLISAHGHGSVSLLFMCEHGPWMSADGEVTDWALGPTFP